VFGANEAAFIFVILGITETLPESIGKFSVVAMSLLSPTDSEDNAMVFFVCLFL